MRGAFFGSERTDRINVPTFSDGAEKSTVRFSCAVVVVVAAAAAAAVVVVVVVVSRRFLRTVTSVATRTKKEHVSGRRCSLIAAESRQSIKSATAAAFRT